MRKSILSRVGPKKMEGAQPPAPPATDSKLWTANRLETYFES